MLAALFFVALVASIFELQRVRARFGEVTRHHFHDHQDVREFIIRARLDGLDSPIIVFGDSLVEMAELPKSLCGKPVVNAGIGGSQTSDFMRLVPKLLEHSKPSAVVIALGANDPSENAKQASDLVRQLRKLAPIVLAMPTTRDGFAAGDFLKDGIHLTREASVMWVSKITGALERSIQNCDQGLK
ncbi:hypothetical protein [Bradyrhizobium sp. RT4b]|uniref:SGNH/GDSL hydrolase family protein n=1 Tax=Bradyrhizobium sp. RT4b TaxID=3156379 RepID=UPI003393B527